MDALPLDPGSYGGTYKLVGGRPSLDFINTISWPQTEREHDWLSSAENVKQWFAAVDLPFPRSKEVDLSALRTVRQLLASALRPLAHGERVSPSVIASIGKAAGHAYQARLIDPHTLAWQWPAPRSAVDALSPILLDAADLLTSGSHERLRCCPSCDWLFEDQTRNGQRRWCDMADCGSRDKSRRYYQRSKA